MAVTSADVPNRYDVVINGEGYMFAEDQEFKADYGYTPTFLPRQSLQGDWGDTLQDFFLTATQRNWVRGEQQRYFRQNDEEAQARYWESENVDVSTPGQAVLRPQVAALASNTFIAVVAREPSTRDLAAFTSSNLFTIAPDGTMTDKGAHGLASTPIPKGVCSDGTDVYFADTASVRKWDGTNFTEFSADGAHSLAFLNNTLFGVYDSTLCKWDTAGTRSDVFPWQQTDGGARSGNMTRIIPYGGRLAILWGDGPNGPELWLHDGTSPAMIAHFPPNFYGYDLNVVNGVLFISGHFLRANSAGSAYHIRPAVYFYAGGTSDLLWEADDFTSGTFSSPSAAPQTACEAFDGGLIFNDYYSGTIKTYNPAVGGVQTIAAYTAASTAQHQLAASSVFFVFTQNNSSTAYRFPGGARPSTGFVTTSLFDFDSSLKKNFHSITVEYDEASDGDGGSVDIAYRVGDLEGSYTTLQSAAVSGTEYDISSAQGRSISVKVTLNKGTSTLGPVVKRIYVRASVSQTSFRRETFVIACGGRDGSQHVQLQDTTLHPKDGLTQATALRTAAALGTKVSITDEFGTFDAVIDMEGFSIKRYRKNEFIAVVPVREI